MKLLSGLKRNRNLILSVCVIYGSLLLLVTRYIGGLGRFISSVVEFSLSAANYFLFLFAPLIESIWGFSPHLNNTVAEVPDIDLSKYSSFSLNELLYKISNFNEALFNKAVFTEFTLWLFNLIQNVAIFLIAF